MHSCPYSLECTESTPTLLLLLMMMMMMCCCCCCYKRNLLTEQCLASATSLQPAPTIA